MNKNEKVSFKNVVSLNEVVSCLNKASITTSHQHSQHQSGDNTNHPHAFQEIHALIQQLLSFYALLIPLFRQRIRSERHRAWKCNRKSI